MNIELNRELEIAKLKTQTASIAGKLKTLWRSLSIDDTGNDDSLFNQNLGDGGDSYLVETLINDVASLHKALSELEVKINPVEAAKPSVENESNLVKELSENFHQRLQQLSRKPERTKQLEEDGIEVGYIYSNAIFESILSQFQELHNAIASLPNITSMELKSLETESIPLKEHYELTLQADSLAILLNKSELFDYLTDIETQGIGGSLELLFSLVHKVCINADHLYCQSLKN
ncbi:hypothetical protein Syn7502_01478 [Synechococcus sp. PCC 7502]|uniref:hypothetical protein n=1 Tax=Synechococcus sp. PCC 7502 TaxID=1173263 RepID=UPI00029F8CBD|nr:hypothetical protein [Synechococcus sp. PCC 7502]AFY73546.1 hypothetical protein Syn7502_01478 [Synechococcus sp. PCC 7502]